MISLRYFREHREWRRSRPVLGDFIIPIYDGDEPVGIDDLAGTMQRYLAAHVKWLLSQPKFFTLTRKDQT